MGYSWIDYQGIIHGGLRKKYPRIYRDAWLVVPPVRFHVFMFSVLGLHRFHILRNMQTDDEKHFLRSLVKK